MQSLHSTQPLSAPAKPAAAPARRPARPIPGPQLPGFMAKHAQALRLLPHSAALAFGGGAEPQPRGFVRPDLPVAEGAMSDSEGVPPPPAFPASTWPRNNIVEAPPAEKIHFRSALEQVSYMTSKEAMGSADEMRAPQKKKGGLFRRRK